MQKNFPPQENNAKGNPRGFCLESDTASPWPSTHKTPWIWMNIMDRSASPCTEFPVWALQFPQVISFPSLAGGTICILLSVPVELQAKHLGGSPGAELLRVLPKWPMNYLFTWFEYLQLQQKEPCAKLMTLKYFMDCLVLLIISTFWIQIVLAVS